MNSLYDATDIYSKEGYSLVDIEAYGDDGLLVLYTGDEESVYLHIRFLQVVK